MINLIVTFEISFTHNYYKFSLNTSSGYDVFSEEPDVDPSVLKPVEKLKWNLSSETIRDIENARNSIDR